MRNVRWYAMTALVALGLAALPAAGAVQAQRQPTPTTAPSPRTPTRPAQSDATQSQAMQGTQMIARLFDTVVANSSVLNQALNDERVVNRLVTAGPAAANQRAGQADAQQIRATYLGDVLNRTEQGMLSQLLNGSNVLARNAVMARTVAGNNDQIQGFMQRNGIARNRLVALDVIGQPAMLYVLGTSQGNDAQQPRDTQSGQRTTTQDGDMGGGQSGERTNQGSDQRASPTPRPRG